MISLLKIFIAIYFVDFAYGYRQNVLDFCSIVMNRDRTDEGCTCVGRTGKSGSPGPRGMRGHKGDKGDEFDQSELMNQLDVLKSRVERMERIPEVALHYCLMGMKSGAIPDSSISSSTDHNAIHAAKFARLDMDSTVGAWCPRTTTVGQWIQVDLGSVHLINATITQGRADLNGITHWVKTYKVACGITEANLSILSDGGKDKIPVQKCEDSSWKVLSYCLNETQQRDTNCLKLQIFQGNSGTTRKAIGWFPQPMNCRYVRLYPQTWERFMCLRMDILKANCP